MKYATPLNLSHNPIGKPVQKSAMSNGFLEMAELLEDFIGCCHRKNYSFRTREAYWGWIKRFILFQRKRDPSDMGAREVEEFLVHLEAVGSVSASTRNQALSALQFLYREVLQLHFDRTQDVGRVEMRTKLPAVLTADEMNRVLSGLSGSYWLMASLLYGTGMQILECIRLRVKDVSIAKNEILVRDGRHELVRRLKIPQELQQAMKTQMEKVFETYCEDMKSKWQGVYLPDAFQIEYPNSSKLLAWQYVFVANRLPHDPRDDKVRRYHVGARQFEHALFKAALDAGISKPPISIL